MLVQHRHDAGPLLPEGLHGGREGAVRPSYIDELRFPGLGFRVREPLGRRCTPSFGGAMGVSKGEAKSQYATMSAAKKELTALFEAAKRGDVAGIEKVIFGSGREGKKARGRRGEDRRTRQTLGGTPLRAPSWA